MRTLYTAAIYNYQYFYGTTLSTYVSGYKKWLECVESVAQHRIYSHYIISHMNYLQCDIQFVAVFIDRLALSTMRRYDDKKWMPAAVRLPAPALVKQCQVSLVNVQLILHILDKPDWQSERGGRKREGKRGVSPGEALHSRICDEVSLWMFTFQSIIDWFSLVRNIDKTNTISWQPQLHLSFLSLIFLSAFMV